MGLRAKDSKDCRKGTCLLLEWSALMHSFSASISRLMSLPCICITFPLSELVLPLSCPAISTNVYTCVPLHMSKIAWVRDDWLFITVDAESRLLLIVLRMLVMLST